MKKGKLKKKKGLTKAAKNKKAFDEVIGDPYGFPEPLDGHYMMLKSRSNTHLGQTEEHARGPVNQARPNPIDFACDVEAAVQDGLRVFVNNDVHGPIEIIKDIFDNTYLLGSGIIFNQQERAKIEQYIGNILVERGISPVTKYFTTIKQ